MTKQLTLLVLLLLLNSCGIFKSYEKYPKREFRGVWIATVVNIDWPKNGNDTADKQKADYLKILDFYEKENYNAVIVQVRASGDAFYQSDYAPYSRFLTGKEGTPPKWNTDVLDWMINEAHERGMEFHAWLNPYRATFDENF
ncbi:MAG: family 10 glycosylhydrolase, partial [Maribacter sp.]